ncbi:NACHT and WD repeat domain-containing protein [Streptomyces sp. TLI_185]|uniref:NACHT and WD repeat domain-containing protein n=1 Tax=Streptomyces sp. TLI_185 TaxID=2485151 RepID=UPI000F4E428C|nr:NACHT and WD repeat domain-containing protein [Streptomyces sp. TLI_185]RPF39304.1 WD40 repeat protein [Streptomyces sp. TLI_185]
MTAHAWGTEGNPSTSGALRAPALPPDELVERQGMFRKVDAWLEDSRSGLCLVTGPPGTGKSVFARQLAARLSAPPHAAEHQAGRTLCLAHYCDPNDDQSLDPLEFVKALSRALSHAMPGFGAAVQASIAEIGVSIRNETSFQIDQMQPGAQAVGLRIDNLSAMGTRRALNRLVVSPLAKVAESSGDTTGGQTGLVVILDDLSASFSYHDEDNISAVLRLLLRRPDERQPSLRFLVTSRPDPWALQGLPQPTITLAHNPELTSDDLARYVGVRLTGTENEQRHAWIDRVVEVSSGNFLVAKHVLDDLLRDPAGLDMDPSQARFPSSLADLYDSWVSRQLQSDRSRWRRCYVPVLGVIAVAQGSGLDAGRIAAITGLPDTTVQEVLEDCTQYLYSYNSDEVRYYHDSFREYLTRRKIIGRDWHRSVTRYLTDLGVQDWNAVDDYTREHLPYHAAQADLLGELVTDAGFLANADARAVERAVWHRSEQAASRDAPNPLLAIYLRTVALLVGLPPGERAARLELAARGAELPDAANAFAAVPAHRPWQPLWGFAIRSYPYQTIGRHPEGVNAMAAFTVDGRDVLATGGQAGYLRIWDLELNEPLIPDIKIDMFGILAVCTCLFDGAWLVLATGPFRGQLRCGPALSEQVEFTADEGGPCITAAALCPVGEEVFAILGFSDGSHTLWDLRSGFYAPLFGADEEAGPVLSLCASDAEGGEVVSGHAHGQVRFWQLQPQEENIAVTESPVLQLENGWVGAVVVTPVPEGLVYVAGYASGGMFISRPGDDPGTVTIHHMHASAASRAAWFRAQVDGNFLRTGEFYNSGIIDYARRLEEKSEEDAADICTIGVYGGVNALAVHAPSGMLASGAETGTVMLTSLDGQGGWALCQFGEPVGAVLFTTNTTGPLLLAADRTGGAIRSWQLDAQSRPTAQLTGSLQYRIRKLTPSADGRYIAVSLEDFFAAPHSETGKVEVFDARSGETVFDFPASENTAAIHVAFPSTTIVLIVTPADGSGPTLFSVGLTSGITHTDVTLAGMQHVYSAVALRSTEPTVVVLGEQDDGTQIITTLELHASGWHQSSTVALARADRPKNEQLHLAYPRLNVTWDALQTHVIVEHSVVVDLLNISDGTLHPLGGFHVAVPASIDEPLVSPVGCFFRGQAAFVRPGHQCLHIYDLVETDTDDGQPGLSPSHDLTGASSVVSVTAASADGQLIAAGGPDGILHWWREGDESAGELDIESAGELDISSPIRHLAIIKDAVVIVATDDHLLALRL